MAKVAELIAEKGREKKKTFFGTHFQPYILVGLENSALDMHENE